MFVTVVLDLETELVPGLTKAQLRAIAARTASLTDGVAVSQQSPTDIASVIEIGIIGRDNQKAARRALTHQDGTEVFTGRADQVAEREAAQA